MIFTTCKEKHSLIFLKISFPEDFKSLLKNILFTTFLKRNKLPLSEKLISDIYG